MQLDKLFLNLGLAGSGAQLLTLLLVLLVLSTVFWLLIGRFRLHNYLINVYIAYALLQVLPKELASFTPNGPILLFLIFIVVLTLMNKYLFDIHQSGSGLAIWQVYVMSLLEVVLTISIIFSFLPTKTILQYISKDSLVYFSDPWWRVTWMAAPLFFLIFVKKMDK
jgi:hypothetical protein